MRDTTGPSPFESIADVRKANWAVGQYFFSEGAISWFHSRVESDLIRGRYFVTSEQCEDGTSFDTKGNPIPATERRFTARVVSNDGSIDSLSAHMQFGSSAEAIEFILQHDNPA